ncbi:hypothetical protein [Propionicimonas sp.]|uniref:hypothetical protein n=1 Tax=Propionicimonas sp. TaxID=1955623 RepID=UPI001855AEB6|nr:hypothetical protein [Propionicimonas sp.]MBU3976963.1 hypothetical protein [Actinomycetota bacterium]MBA3020534.1 hypothetical protein [Propionicimonas sp.]MBU3986708.1 hypothetical protein [Actinomycetota bacterium]MBU4007140.1 hypothetical protein [Actinomycetota bacterium]MBU4064893.1 hypothetical protein [Actinomycetota bacterium]
MARSVPVASLVIGLAALGMVLFRVLSGDWTMPVIVAIGVGGALAGFVAWWQWDVRVFTRTISRLQASGAWDVIVGGYLVAAEFHNVEVARPKIGEVVLAAGPAGLGLFDPRQRAEQATLTLSWTDIIDLIPGKGTFFGEDRPAIVVSTMEGRIVVVMRTSERLGIVSAGSAQTEVLIDQVRRLRPNAHFE